MNAYKSTKYLIAAIMTLMVLHQGHAQSFPYVHYTTSDGLINNSVFCCYQDHYGFMWFGTENGVSRFDGNLFKNYTIADGIPGNIVTSITEDENGTIFFGTKSQGIACLTQKGIQSVYKDTVGYLINSFLTITNGKSYSLNSGSGLVITDINKGKIIKSYLEVEPGGNQPARFYYCLVKSKDKKLLIGSNNGIQEIVNDSPVYYMVKGLPIRRISYLKIKEDTLMACSGQMVYKVINKHVVDSFDVNDKSTGDISNISIQGQKIWIGTRNSNIYFYENKKIHKYYSPDINFVKYHLTDVFTDNEGNAWFATYTNGLYCIKSPYLTLLSSTEPLSEAYITALQQLSKDSVLVGTSNGVFLLNVKSLSGKLIIKSKNINYTYYVHQITKDSKKSILIVESSSEDQHLVDKIKIGNIPTIIFHGPSVGRIDYNRFVKGDYHGAPQLFYIIGNKIDLKRSLFLRKGLNAIRSNCICIDSNKSIYIGTSKGLFRSDTMGNIMTYKFKPLCAAINCIIQYNRNEFWVGSDLGLVFDSLGIIKSYEEINNERIGSVKSIVLDKDRNVWIGSINGLFLKTGSFLRKLDLNNGLPSNQINSLELSEDNKRLFIGTSKGLVVLDRHAFLKLIFEPPHLYLLTVNSLYKSYTPNQHDFIFTSKERTLNISFTGISLSLAKQLIYQYRLDENIWTSTTGNVLQLIDQSYGHHKVELRCGYGNNIWSKPTVFNFEIITPFWLTSWFISITIALVLLAIFIIVRLRINSIRKANKERITYNNHIAELRQQALAVSMNPHFIFNALNSIQSFINTQEPVMASEYLGKFARLIRKSVDLSDQTYISVKEEIIRLEGYLELEKLRLGEKLEYQIDILGDDLYELYIPNMIIQPFVENAIWHGILPTNRNGKVIVRIKAEAPFLIIEIEDNGIGYKMNPLKENHISMGMNIVKERLLSLIPQIAIGEVIQVINKADALDNETGTIIKLRLMLKTNNH